ncbi:MAG: hypothetical protein WC028_23715 [Candidatus Obscuribacterales bacterium]|jgi:hypothetical protein
MKELIAFHGNQAVKEKYLARVLADKEAGMIRQHCNYMERRDPPIYYNKEEPKAYLLDGTGIIRSAQTDKQYEAIKKIAHLCRIDCLDEASWLSIDITAVREVAAETAAAKRKDFATASAAAAALWATAAAEAVASWADGMRRGSAYAIDQSAEWAFQRVLTVKYIEADDGNIEALTFWKKHIAQRNIQIEIINPMADKFLQVLELAPVPD